MQRTSIEIAGILREAGYDVRYVTTGDGPVVDACRRDNLPVTIVEAPAGLRTFDKRVMFGSPHVAATSLVEVARFGRDLVTTLRPMRPQLIVAMTNRIAMLSPLFRLAGLKTVVYGQNTIPLGWRAVPVVAAAHLLPQMSPRSFEAFPRSLRWLYRSKFELLPLGIDTTPFLDGGDPHRDMSGDDLCPGSVRIVAVSAVNERKGITEMAAAVAELRASGHDVSLTVVGDAPTDAAKRLAAGVQSQHGDYVEFPGYVDDVRPYLAAADIGLVGSREEGGPRVLFEMMASGLPVVATDVGYCREVLAKRDAGIVVEACRPGALIDGLLPLITDAALREAMGTRARRTAAEDYTRQEFARRLTRLVAEGAGCP